MSCLQSRVRESCSRSEENFGVITRILALTALRLKKKLSAYDKVSLSLPIHLVSGVFIVTYMVSRNPEVAYAIYPSNSFWKQRWMHMIIVFLSCVTAHLVLSFIVFSSFIILTFLHNCKEWTEERIWGLKRQGKFCLYLEFRNSPQVNEFIRITGRRQCINRSYM